MLTPVLKHPEKVVIAVVIKPEVATNGKQISVGVKFQFGVHNHTVYAQGIQIWFCGV
jgi:hypothetical protein